MKPFLTFILLLFAELSFAQLPFPDFLQGTWKMEDKEIYEHWDRLNDNALKGFSYRMVNGQMIVSEYLDISRKGNEVIYTATVLDQNQAKGVSFKLAGTDSTFVFENAEHDFPKKIVYQKLGDAEIFVHVSDGEQKGFAHKMKRQNAKPLKKDEGISNPNFDAALAEKLGADDYGMKKFVFVVLKTGNSQTTDKKFISETFKGHLENINRLVEEGKLVVAGPFGKNENNYRGIFIFHNVPTLEAAEDLLQTDPAVKAGLLDFELYNWYGSAALPEYLGPADKIWKTEP